MSEGCDTPRIIYISNQDTVHLQLSGNHHNEKNLTYFTTRAIK